MKKQQKTDYFESTTKPSLFLGEASFTVPLLEKTNPILTPKISLQPLILQWFTTISFKIPQKKRTQLKPILTPLKPSLFSGETSFSGNLFLRNKPNLSSLKLTATTCCMGTYNDLQTKPKNGANPNKPNFKAHKKTADRSLRIGQRFEIHNPTLFTCWSHLVWQNLAVFPSSASQASVPVLSPRPRRS